MTLYEILKSIEKFFLGTIERPSQQNIVPDGNIRQNQATAEINFDTCKIPFTKPPTLIITGVADTNSMDGVMDQGNNILCLAGADAENRQILCDWLKVGDIAIYEANGGYIIHRIIKIMDEDGRRRFVFKGDNNGQADPYKIYDENIRCVLAGIIY